MTLQEILNTTEYPIETVYEGTSIQITYDPKIGYHDVAILEGPAEGVCLTGPSLEHLLINIPEFAKLFNHGPKTYGSRIERLEEEVAQLKQEKDTDLSTAENNTYFPTEGQVLLIALLDDVVSSPEEHVKPKLGAVLQSFGRSFGLKRSVRPLDEPYTLETKDGTLFEVDIESQKVTKITK